MRMIRVFKKYFYKITNKIILKKNRVQYKENLVINGFLKIVGRKKSVSLGRNITINSGTYTVPIGFGGKCVFWTLGEGHIEIGENCGLTNTTICSMKDVQIGKHVLLGSGVKIYDTDFHSLDYLKRRDIVNDNDRKALPVVIGDDVFIGAGTIILKGTKIGDCSIIGAGSVVSGIVPSGEIWAGNPARFIKKIMENT